ncbi:hypothetical protein V8E53_000825, partial [Lactarius tabidus]
MSNRVKTIESLTMREILAAVPQHTFDSVQSRTRTKLRTAANKLPPHIFALLEGAAAAKICSSETSHVPVSDPVPCPFSSSTTLSAVAAAERAKTAGLLTMNEMLDALPSKTFRADQKRSRACMEEAVYALPQNVYDILSGASAAKKRRLDDAALLPFLVQENPSLSAPFSFFETVSEQCRRDRIAKFIDGTGQKATARSVCALCAGSFFLSETERVPLSILHDCGKLTPSRRHPSHVLTDGMLLHRNASSFSTDSA